MAASVLSGSISDSAPTVVVLPTPNPPETRIFTGMGGRFTAAGAGGRTSEGSDTVDQPLDERDVEREGLRGGRRDEQFTADEVADQDLGDAQGMPTRAATSATDRACAQTCRTWPGSKERDPRPPPAPPAGSGRRWSPWRSRPCRRRCDRPSGGRRGLPRAPPPVPRPARPPGARRPERWWGRVPPPEEGAVELVEVVELRELVGVHSCRDVFSSVTSSGVSSEPTRSTSIVVS